MYFLLLSLFLAFPLAAAAAPQLTGKVIAITDGDTLTLLTGSRQHVQIRLAEIDTPERGQPYGTKAKQTLAALAFGKQARVEMTDRDRYGRMVGKVYVGELDINAEMIRQGAAWVYRQYLHDTSLVRLEDEARSEERGLWALPEAQRIPPWTWRHAGRQREAPTSLAQPMSNAAFTCGGKRYCREMVSCAEARFYLEQCRLSRLDGDQDGIPCETLCR